MKSKPTGVHKDINKVVCDSFVVSEVYPKLFQSFPNIKSFTCNKNEIKNLKNGDFYGVNTLIELVVTLNLIEELGESVFNGAPNLSTVILDGNFIKNVNRNAFRGAKTVKKISLSHNLITHLDKETFADNSVLKYLCLQNNRIRHLDFELFNPGQTFLYVDFSYNYIKTVKFQSVSNIRRFIFTENICASFKETNGEIGPKLQTCLRSEDDNGTDLITEFRATENETKSKVEPDKCGKNTFVLSLGFAFLTVFFTWMLSQ